MDFFLFIMIRGCGLKGGVNFFLVLLVINIVLLSLMGDVVVFFVVLVYNFILDLVWELVFCIVLWLKGVVELLELGIFGKCVWSGLLKRVVVGGILVVECGVVW